MYADFCLVMMIFMLRPRKTSGYGCWTKLMIEKEKHRWV